MRTLHVNNLSNNSWGGDVKDKPDSKKAEGKDGANVVAKKKDAEVQTIKLKEAKGKDKVDWSDELGKKEKADNIPNFQFAYA